MESLCETLILLSIFCLALAQDIILDTIKKAVTIVTVTAFACNCYTYEAYEAAS